MARKRNCNNRACRQWENLADDILFMISMRLGVIEYLMFGGVCKSWRSVAVDNKEQFMATQPPLMFILSPRAMKFCSFLNVFDGKRYKTRLPDLIGRRCWGFSGGFVITQSRVSNVWLVNPITRQELCFPFLSHTVGKYMPSYYRAILAYSEMLSDFVIVVVYKCRNVLRFCRPDKNDWSVYYSYDHRTLLMVDVAVFKGKIYVLTGFGRIGVFKLGRDPNLTVVDVKGTPKLGSQNLQLVTSNEHLFMVDFQPGREALIYKLIESCENMSWMKIENLGEESLFLRRESNCSAMRNPTKWGGRGNSIYYLDAPFKKVSIYSLDGREVDSFSINKPPGTYFDINPLVWYFSDQCYRRNVVD